MICDLPVRFDTYEGCAHGCEYCFATRKRTDMSIDGRKHESVGTLKRFIQGERVKELAWCDWNIPIHWGGMSDPFQPIELEKRYSLDALHLFAETKYPFVVSTKNKMIAEEPYLSLIKECNCVVQFSACCRSYDNFERGASTFQERLEAAKKISVYKRVVIRCQPYIPSFFNEVMGSIDAFHDAGVYGCVFEGIKFTKKVKGTIKLQGDYVYPSDVYKRDFQKFKAKLHAFGMRFYSGENRLRKMGDDLCCCGVDGLGWKVNTANLNHYLYDRDGFVYSDASKKDGTAAPFHTISQNSVSRGVSEYSYKTLFEIAARDKNIIRQLVPDGTI